MEAHYHEGGKRTDGPIPDDLVERSKVRAREARSNRSPRVRTT
jgi:hypothetical protein